MTTGENGNLYVFFGEYRKSKSFHRKDIHDQGNGFVRIDRRSVRKIAVSGAMKNL
jgi:hypothetical protein